MRKYGMILPKRKLYEEYIAIHSCMHNMILHYKAKLVHKIIEVWLRIN